MPVPSLEEPDEGIGEQAEYAVNEQRDEDHVVLQELRRLADHESEPGVGVDLLGHHQREPGDAQALPQAHQHLRQRAR
jgi:hypothetical protein